MDEIDQFIRARAEMIEQRLRSLAMGLGFNPDDESDKRRFAERYALASHPDHSITLRLNGGKDDVVAVIGPISYKLR